MCVCFELLFINNQMNKKAKCLHVSEMLMNKTGKMTGVFTKLGRFYESCLEFGEKPEDFTPGESNKFDVITSSILHSYSLYIRSDKGKFKSL